MYLLVVVNLLLILRTFFFIQYLEKVPHWRNRCENLQIPETVMSLEDVIHQHQSLMENIAQAYTEVRTSLILLSSYMEK